MTSSITSIASRYSADSPLTFQVSKAQPGLRTSRADSAEGPEATVKSMWDIERLVAVKVK